MRVTKQQNSCNNTESSTIRAKTIEIAIHRTFTSGVKVATAVQPQDEVKARSAVEREAIVSELHSAGAKVEVRTTKSWG